jgi:guanylate kinase
MKRIVLCGASCSGKTTIKQRLIDRGLSPSVSYTTRPMREHEIEAHDYHFVSKERFEELIEQGFFFEYDDVFGDYYGTSMRDLETRQIFILTPRAISKLRGSNFSESTLVVQLTAPLETRTKRSTERGDSVVQILMRISRDNKSFSYFKDHDVILDTDQNTEEEIIKIIEGYDIQ